MVRVVAGAAFACRVSVAVVPSTMTAGLNIAVTSGSSLCSIVTLIVLRLGLPLMLMISLAVVCAVAMMG